MEVKVYTITDRKAIELIMANAVEEFRSYLKEEEYLYFGEPEVFGSEKEALAYCAGIGKGKDERAMPERYPLRSNEQEDLAYIEAIERY